MAESGASEPLSIDELRRLAMEGVVRPETIVTREGASGWRSFADVEAGTDTPCSQCGQLFHPDDLAQFRRISVCATCKPEFLQKLREGVPVLQPGGAVLAGRWRRLWGSCVDAIVALVINVPLQWYSGAFERNSAPGAIFQFRIENALWAVFGLSVFLALNWRLLAQGQTIGKRLLGMKIVRKNGADADRTRIILYRVLPVQAAVLIPIVGMLVGYLDVFFIFRSSRYTLHDDIADTKVIDVRE
ncbi:MAG TPA: RDD family protein [Terriglobia bacterium]|nr:RDD family protein [Terriglobia bacterium]